MTVLVDLRQEVLQKIEQLPQEQLFQVLKFLSDLESVSQAPPETIPSHEVENDPLADFIGGVGQGNLATNIDRNLYE